MKVAPMAASKRSCCSLFIPTIGWKKSPCFFRSVSQRLCSFVTAHCYTNRRPTASSLSLTPINESNKGLHRLLHDGTTNRLSSSRGRDAVGLLPTYLSDARAVARYDATSNPNGALQLGVAESQMLQDWLVPALNKMPSLEADSIYYQPTSGRDDFKQSMSRYIEDLCGLERGRLRVDGLILGAGCNAVLENLCFALADIGDTVLIPTPYYAAFEFDLVARAGLRIQSVTTERHHPECTSYVASNGRIDPRIYYPNRASLDAAFERTLDQHGRPPKILLISHPMNPLGICYPAETIRDCIEWCRERQVHLISDEIYAGSVYRNSTSFLSALKVGENKVPNGDSLGLGPYVHWVYALSKDMALSGLRIGAAYTENTEILTPMQKLNDLCQISSQTQLWTKSILEAKLDIHNEELWIAAFRRDNHARLNARSTALAAVLEKYDIPYLSPDAGLFLWIDLSQFLPTVIDPALSTVAAAQQERSLYLELVQDYGLLLTPGNSMRNERPGFFRCVFTAASDDEFEIALQRMEGYLAARTSRSVQQ
jgi:aspartate/methionine/tyrosine aminotransferase